MGVGMVPMVVVVMVVVTMAYRNRDAIGLTNPCAFLFTESTGFREPLNVVMVTGLIKSNFLLKAQHLSSVFT